MKSLRIAHIADTHLGYKYSVLPGRDDDFSKSWLQACDAIVDSSPDLIIHAGDVFHSHRPDWKALTAFHQGLDILKSAGVPIYIIAGNHDTSGISSLHTVFTFTSNIHSEIVATNDAFPSTYYESKLDCDVVLVPHRSLLNPALDQHVRSIVESLQGTYRILVSHGSISKEDSPSEVGSVAIPHSITEHEWDYMAFGHLHMAQPYGQRGWYSGSTERCGWSDLPAEPAWTLVEIGENHLVRHWQVPVPHMPFIDLPDRDAAGLTPADLSYELIDLLETIGLPEERAHVRVKISNLSASAKRPLDNLIRKAMGKQYPNTVVSINLEAELPRFLSDYDAKIQSDLKPLKDMFQEFIAERHYEDLKFEKEFLEKGLDLLGREQRMDDNE